MADSRLELHDVPAESVKGPVPVAVLLPPGYEAAGAPLPLSLTLHGGGEDRDFLGRLKPFVDPLWDDGSLPPLVHVMPQSGPLSWYWGWETFLTEELPAWMAERYNAGTDGAATVVTGASMGGLGSLRLAFKNPQRFAALAALEPGVEPGFRYQDIATRNTWYRFPEIDRARFGEPIDEAEWASESPLALARQNARAIRNSDLKIYLEVGDRDALNLHDGTEFLHRVLWELDIRHEYHLVYDADHVGTSLGLRHQEAYRFLGTALKPQPVEAPYQPNDQEKAWGEWVGNDMTGPPPERIDILGPRASGFLEWTLRDKKAKAIASDPTTKRNYGCLPEPR